MEEVPIDTNETDTKFFVDDFFNNANTTGNGNETISSYQCTGATYDELKIYSYFSFWIGGIFQLVVIFYIFNSDLFSGNGNKFSSSKILSDFTNFELFL